MKKFRLSFRLFEDLDKILLNGRDLLTGLVILQGLTQSEIGDCFLSKSARNKKGFLAGSLFQKQIVQND